METGAPGSLAFSQRFILEYQSHDQTALQTALQRLNSANISDTYWAHIRKEPMPMYTAPSYLVSISHESFTAGQRSLLCMDVNEATNVKTLPRGVRCERGV